MAVINKDENRIVIKRRVTKQLMDKSDGILIFFCTYELKR